MVKNDGRKHHYAVLVPSAGQSWQDLAKDIQAYYQEGFHVFALDGRGSGMSGGAYTTLGWFEQFDVLRWVEYLSKFDEHASIVLVGRDTGANAILFATGEALPHNVKCVVSDGAYANYKEYVVNLLSGMCSTETIQVDGKLLAPSVSLMMKQFLNFGLDDIHLEQSLQNSKTPILFIPRVEEENMIDGDVFDNYYACAAEKELITFPNLNEWDEGEPKNYYEEVFKKIHRYL